jgi:hypothetical protein
VYTLDHEAVSITVTKRKPKTVIDARGHLFIVRVSLSSQPIIQSGEWVLHRNG